MSDLRAAPLEGRTLTQALRALAADVSDGEDRTVTVESTADDQPLPSRIEVALYRIAQEALTNAVQHAAAERIEVRLVVGPDRVRLVIDDDGSGFDAGCPSEGRFGLVGLRERARLLGGEFSLESSHGAGTRIEVSVALTADPADFGAASAGASPPSGESGAQSSTNRGAREQR